MSLKYLLSIVVASFVWVSQLEACTTAIISGKSTPDGRPLLFKQRDTPSLHNKLVAFSDGKYKYNGLVNSQDSLGRNVWGGNNSEGFAIMNSASYNLNPKDEDDSKSTDGIIMKLALQNCKTLSDFEHLLDSLPKPLNVSSNFGVIDAFGGAAYYETGDYSYTKFDANDVTVAPLGYLIRTNYSFSGDRSRDKGLSRYLAAERLFNKASLSNSISVDFLIDGVSRHLVHGLTNVDLSKEALLENGEPNFKAFRDFIPRYLTASAIVVQGILPNESPALTTMWTTLGFPLATISVPVWVDNAVELPSLLSSDEFGKSRLNEWTLELKKQLFPIERGEGNDYIDVSVLLTSDNQGILQKVRHIESSIWSESESFLSGIRKQNNINKKELREFYKWVDQFTENSYYENFPYLSIK